jgi:putative transcriptional regulator
MKTIRELRDAQGWSQAELAYRLGVSPSTIYNWESGRSEPRLAQFKELALMLGVRMEDIEIPETATKKLVAA